MHNVKLKNCRVCNSDHSKFLFQLRDSREEIRFFHCLECGMIYTDLILFERRVQETYSENYFKEHYLEVLASKVLFFNDILESIENETGRVGKILDVGCGIGTFLEIARDRGWDTTGIEVSSFAAQYARDKKLRVYEGFVGQVPLEYKEFDLITAWDVIEHVEKPIDFLSIINSILKEDGFLVLKMPNTCSISVRFYMKLSHISKRDYIHATTHLSHFTAKTISLALKKAHFRVFKIKTASDSALIAHDIWWKKCLWKMIAGFLRCADIFHGQRASLVVMAKKK
ncbi:MAG: hypothetical protein SRB1_02452 [Desulfobacteraceae bacterium Eth-SRB1]|nr:MAG: hypothetical protein SRB1_02452 [Desulfobacteraceae bacterium Eth-SRB1]